MNFWQKLKKKCRPILVLAPMADVTDPAFRRIIAKYGKPDVMWTEFVSADGLFLGGRDHLLPDLQFDESERPIVAQFFSSRPEMMEKAAYLASELGFDGIDINMGCPDKSIEKQGAGAAMIKNPALAIEVIAAAKKGAQTYADEKGTYPLPVSVKTRIGYNSNELDVWLPILLSSNLAVVTIHARTRKEMSLVPARWEQVKRAVEIRDELKSETLIFGNGDALDLLHANELALETKADGVMLGRAIFGNPWLFDGKKEEYSIEFALQKLNVLIEHAETFEKLLPNKNFAIMKKHFKAYITKAFEGTNNPNIHAKDLRLALMEAKNSGEVRSTIKSFATTLKSF